MTAPTDSEKREQIEDFLEGDHVLLHINPAMSGVTLPDYLTRELTVTLRISRHYQGSLDLQETKIVADLRFSGVYTTCIIPYSALWGCTSSQGEFVLWAAAEHTKLFEQLSTKPAIKAAEPSQTKKPPVPGSKKKPQLRRVK